MERASGGRCEARLYVSTLRLSAVALALLVSAAALAGSAFSAEIRRGLSIGPLPSAVERRNFPLEYDPNFTPRRPEIVAPSPVGPRTYGSPAMLPEGAAWYAYCAVKHPSFDPGTGLYTTYSGRRVPCRP
jgi:hypothetical protein